MTQQEIKGHIDQIIQRTFTTLKQIYDYHKEGKDTACNYAFSRLIFPQYSQKYRDGEIRLSEQELRFTFVEQFNKYCDENKLSWLYSVETPTELKYRFSTDGSQKQPDVNEKDGQSAMVDLAIHDSNMQRIALIEFKALNPDKFCFEKDFVKLNNEPVENTYFVMFVNDNSQKTIESLQAKIAKKDASTHFYCFNLKKGKSITKDILNI